eukprot:3285780-Rhodomonas_salina.3
MVREKERGEADPGVDGCARQACSEGFWRLFLECFSVNKTGVQPGLCYCWDLTEPARQKQDNTMQQQQPRIASQASPLGPRRR